MNQYQTELQKVIESTGDIEKFKEEWFQRSCEAYRKHKGHEKDFRKGKIHIE